MELTIAFCGDVMLGGELRRHIGSQSVADWLGDVSVAWKEADLLIGNLESPCVVNAQPTDGRVADLVHHVPADRLAELAAAGFSAVTLANNHILDCGALGLLETIQGLDQVGIYHAGAGSNLAEALQPTFIPIRGLMIALVAFCYGPAATRSRPGAAPYNPKLMRGALRVARANADLVIAALHDGLEYSDVPPSQTRARFRFLVENGADIVVGHHPHVLQGLEWYKNVPIAYSLGDLLFDNSLPGVSECNFSRIAIGRHAPQEVRRDPWKFIRGALLTVYISGRRKSVRWHPFRQDFNLRPQLSSGETKVEDLRRLEELSAALLNEKDPRHVIADSVLAAVRRENLRSLGIRELLRLSLRPKWRYIPGGLKWLHERMKFV